MPIKDMKVCRPHFPFRLDKFIVKRTSYIHYAVSPVRNAAHFHVRMAEGSVYQGQVCLLVPIHETNRIAHNLVRSSSPCVAAHAFKAMGGGQDGVLGDVRARPCYIVSRIYAIHPLYNHFSMEND